MATVPDLADPTKPIDTDFTDLPASFLRRVAGHWWNGTAWVPNTDGGSGTAGSPAGGVSSVQGVSGGTPVNTSSVGITAAANFTPAGAAYSAGDIMDVAKELIWTYADGTTVRSGSLIRVLTTIMKIDETAIISGETSYTLQLYSVTPPSAQADNAAWTLASADLTAYRGSIGLGIPVDLGAAAYVKSQYVDMDVKLTGTSLFGELVTVGGFTATAIARQVLLYGMVL